MTTAIAPAPLPTETKAAPIKPAAPPQFRRGKVRSARRIGVYGPSGVGKTTLLASVPDIILFDIEAGSGDVDVARYMFNPADELLGHRPRTLDEVRNGMRWLRDQPHPFRALGIDTMDALEALVMSHITRRENVRSLEDFGFGKGWVMFQEEFRLLLSQLEDLRSRRGLDIIMLAHSTVRTHKNPSGDDYDRYVPKLHDKVVSIWTEQCDELGFIHFDGGAKKATKFARAKGWSSGKRIIEFDRTAAWEAKARLPLPSSVEVGIDSAWAPFAAAIRQAYQATPEEIRALIREQLERIGDPDTTAKATAALDLAGDDKQRLEKWLHELRRREAVVRESSDDAQDGAS